MSKSFASMSTEEQQELVKKIAEVLGNNELGDTAVEMVTEQVCNLKAKNVNKNTSCVVKKDLPADQSAKADKINAELKTITEGITGVQVSIAAKIGAGDKYQTIEGVQDIRSTGDETVSLAHKEGEVWLLDFWATWCPPCQRPMAHNQEMLEKRGADWGGKVRIIGVSIDSSKDAVVKHVDNKKWTSVEHYFRAGSKCSETYSVRGVPHVMLIDTKGNIAFKGHPANRKDLEADFDALLRGETLTGEGCGDSGAVPEGYKEVDVAAVNTEIETIKGVMDGFTTDEEVAKLAADQQRCFNVITFQLRYTANSAQFLGKYTNIRLVQGSQDSNDKLKAIFEEKVKGTFELDMRETAV